MSEGPSRRLAALDGLRGWAALSVVVFHLSWETFGALFPIYRSFPAALLGNGNFAVALFLMVSGYVLTVRGWHEPDKTAVRRSIVKRYFRLTIPIFVAVMLFYAVLKLGWALWPAASQIVHRPDWLSGFGNFHTSLLSAAWFGLVGLYVTTRTFQYGPFLWTMTAELWGSYLVLALCLFEMPRRWSYGPLAILTVLGLLLPLEPFFPMAACYPAGALVALMSRDGLIASGLPSRTESRVATAMAVAAYVAGSLADKSPSEVIAMTLLAMVLFVAAMRSGPVSAFLSLPLSQWLGRISFPLYLVQILIIMTISSGLILLAQDAGLLTARTALGIVAVSLAACLAAAQLFMPVERLALSVAARIGRRTRPAPAPAGPA
ncbi:MAG TPA: acyltransferase [Devosia sp.]|nr:acyltransferase [Devosia sp.]